VSLGWLKEYLSGLGVTGLLDSSLSLLSLARAFEFLLISRSCRSMSS
jgi:hypothetical protein